MDNDHQVSNYDRAYGSYHDSHQFIKMPPRTVKSVDFLGRSETFIVETVRTEAGDIVFIECHSCEGDVRLRLPAKVATALFSQRVSLAGKVRRVKAKAAMKVRMANGFVPTPPPRRSRKKKNAAKKKPAAPPTAPTPEVQAETV